jgi:hypothetical protein
MRTELPGRVGIVLLLLILASSRAYAYIDPGTGSFMLQMLLAGFFTLLFMLKNLRTKIVNFVRSLFKKRSDDHPR